MALFVEWFSELSKKQESLLSTIIHWPLIIDCRFTRPRFLLLLFQCSLSSFLNCKPKYTGPSLGQFCHNNEKKSLITIVTKLQMPALMSILLQQSSYYDGRVSATRALLLFSGSTPNNELFCSLSTLTYNMVSFSGFHIFGNIF